MFLCGTGTNWRDLVLLNRIFESIRGNYNCQTGIFCSVKGKRSFWWRCSIELYATRNRNGVHDGYQHFFFLIKHEEWTAGSSRGVKWTNICRCISGSWPLPFFTAPVHRADLTSFLLIKYIKYKFKFVHQSIKMLLQVIHLIFVIFIHSSYCLINNDLMLSPKKSVKALIHASCHILQDNNV